MKIRCGFVSNSSSSSFCLFGDCIETSVLRSLGKDEYDDIDDMLQGFDLGYTHGIENYYNQICIGLSPRSMKEDETLREFRNRVQESIKLFYEKYDIEKEVTCDWMTDGGHDG